MTSSVVSEGRERSVPSRNRVKILLVDEDQGNVAYYQLILRRMGCQVRACGSYDEGLSALASEQFNLVVVNQGGPGFEGKAVLQRVIEIDRHLPVLVLTRCHDIGCYLEAMQLGAVDYLEQPVKAPDLIRTLETHLGLWRAPSSSVDLPGG